MPRSIDRKLLRIAPVEVRIRNATPAMLGRFGQQAGFFRSEGRDFVFRSALGAGHTISEHMIWLHGMLQFERKKIRQAQEAGAEIVIRIYLESREVALSPQAILLAHLLQLPTEISFIP